jgi:hypothetical protein
VIAKGVLAAFLWLMKRGAKKHVNPIKLSAATCAFIAAVFGAIAGAVHTVEERVSKSESKKSDLCGLPPVDAAPCNPSRVTYSIARNF